MVLFLKKRVLYIFLLTLFCIFQNFSLCSGNPEPTFTSDTVDSFDNAFQALRDERDALRAEIGNLKIEQRALIDDMKKRLEAVEEEKQRYNEALDTAAEQITELKEDKEELTGRFQDVESEAARFNEAIDKKDSDIAALAQENEGLKAELGDAQKALEKAANRIQTMKTEEESLEAELDVMREERKKILFGYDDDLKTIKEGRERLTAQLKAAENKLKIAEEKSGSSGRDKELFIRKHKEEIQKILNEKRALEEKLAESDKERDALIKKYETEIAQMAKESSNLKKKIEDLEFSKKIYKTKLELLEEKENSYKTRISELEAEREKIKEKEEAAPFASRLLEP